MTLIQTITAGVGGIANADFQGIAAGYKWIRLEATIRSNAAANTDIVIRVNNDSGANYFTRGILNGADGAQSGVSAARIGQAVTSASAQPYTCVTEFLNYDGTTWRKEFIFSGYGHDGVTGLYWTGGGVWTNTAAINRITVLQSDSNNLGQNSVVKLYGVN